MKQLIVFLALNWALPLAAFETAGSTAFVVDQNTGTVVYEKNADTPLPPASMSKLMTLNMLFEAIEDGRVTLDTEFRVSTNASKKGGSKMFLRDGASVRVEDLIRGIIVQSGNDACIVVAENLAGSEDIFAEAMTTRARQLGMTQSTFANATGWPDPNHRMSARDLVFLADRLITKFPQYYTYFAEESFTWEGITQKNRNPLLGRVEGADGLKTGHTSEAGYGLVGSAKQGDRRVIFIVSGLDSQAARTEEAARVANWAFRQFVEKALVAPGLQVASAPVWMGAASEVGLQTIDGVTAIVPALAAGDPKMEVRFNGPIEAPIAKGTEIAELLISIEGMGETSYPLVASETVERGGIVTRIKASALKVAQTYLGLQPTYQ